MSWKSPSIFPMPINLPELLVMIEELLDRKQIDKTFSVILGLPVCLIFPLLDFSINVAREQKRSEFARNTNRTRIEFKRSFSSDFNELIAHRVSTRIAELPKCVDIKLTRQR